MNYSSCNGIVYTIKSGDTLYKISGRYSIPVALLLRANPFIDIYNIQAGDRICIPTTGGVPMLNRTHMVKKGDSVGSILNEHDLSLDELVSENPVDTMYLKEGTTLNLPVRGRKKTERDHMMNHMNDMEPMNHMNDMEPMNHMNDMEPMNHMNDMEPMNHMNDMEPMNHMNDMEPMNHMNDMEPMNRMNDIEPMNHMNDIEPMNHMNDMEPMKRMNDMGTMKRMNDMGTMNRMIDMNDMDADTRMERVNDMYRMNDVYRMNDIYRRNDINKA